jgi:hypothetical protein
MCQPLLQPEHCVCAALAPCSSNICQVRPYQVAYSNSKRRLVHLQHAMICQADQQPCICDVSLVSNVPAAAAAAPAVLNATGACKRAWHLHTSVRDGVCE